MGYTLMMTGMLRRMGNDSTPSVVLHTRQVMQIIDYIDDAWAQAQTFEAKQDIAMAAITHIGFWLTWLCSCEFFSVDWEDMDVITPDTCHAVADPGDLLTFFLNTAKPELLNDIPIISVSMGVPDHDKLLCTLERMKEAGKLQTQSKNGL